MGFFRRDGEDSPLYMTIEETAAALSVEEGKVVTEREVHKIEAQAIRKLRNEIRRRGLMVDDLLFQLSGS